MMNTTTLTVDDAVKMARDLAGNEAAGSEPFCYASANRAEQLIRFRASRGVAMTNATVRQIASEAAFDVGACGW